MKMILLVVLFIFCGCTENDPKPLDTLYPEKDALTTYHKMIDYFNSHVTYYKETWQSIDQDTNQSYSYITENLNDQGSYQRYSVEKKEEDLISYQSLIVGDSVFESMLDESTNTYTFNERFLIHTGSFMENLLNEQENFNVLTSRRKDYKERIELFIDFKIDDHLFLTMIFTIGESGFLKEINTHYFDQEELIGTNQFFYVENIQISGLNEKKELPIEEMFQKILQTDQAYHTLMNEISNTEDFTLTDFDTFITQKEYLVGSSVYTQLLMTAKGNAREKLELLLKQLGATIDRFNMLQLAAFDRFDETLAPHSFFLRYVAMLVQEAFPEGLLADYTQENAWFVRSIHQLRMYFDKVNLNYVRNYFKKAGMTDEQALSEYAKRWGVEPQHSPARFHNKFPKGKTFKETIIGRENRKILINNGFHSEFILNPQGEFVSSWNILHMNEGQVESDPDKYTFTFDSRKELLDGESFNYADKNDQVHRLLDSDPPRKLDHDIRQRAKKGWISATITEYFNRHPNVLPMIIGVLLFIVTQLFLLVFHKRRQKRKSG